jgi:hypothetical protein
MATTAENVQQIYIGLLGRAADQAGLTYWADQIDAGTITLDQVRANIVNEQPEYATGLGAMSRADAVTELYSRMFERAPEAAGAEYWTTGEGSTVPIDQLSITFMNAALGDDITTLANKTEAAQYYTAAAGDNYTDASALTAIDSVDSTTASVTASKATTDGAFPSGSTFALTTGADPVVGTANNDVITGAVGTLGATDLISDASTTDNDTLNVTLETADFGAQATISNIENINVSIDEFTGTNSGTVDATNISGATITLASSKLGFDGLASVLIAGDNNVTAGTNVTDLTVTDIEAGVINAGSATTVTLDTLGATDVLNVIANGDLTLANAGTADAVKLTVTAAAEIDVQGAADLTVEGAVDVTLLDADNLTTQTITNNLTAGTLTAVIAGNADASSWTVDNVQVATNALTLTGSGAIVTEVTDAAVVTYTVVGGDAAVDTATISTATDMTTLTAKTGLLSAAINVTAAATIGTLDTAAIDTTLDIAADVTVSTLTSTGDVTVTGTGDLTVTNTTATSIDASGLTGAVTMTNASTGAELEITGGSGNNELVVGDATTSITGGAGNDTVDATALATNTKSLSVALGGGDDIVILTNPKKTVALDFGTGTADQLTLTDAADLTESTLAMTVTGLDIIEVQENGSTDVTATVNSSFLTGQSYAVSANDDGADGGALNLTVETLAADTTVDLSSLVLTNVDSIVIDASASTGAVAITGSSTADTITGSGNGDTIIAGAGADSITVGAGATTVSGGTGADTFTYAADDTSEANMSTISDFSIAEFDVLTLAQNVVVADLAIGDTVDISSADADSNLAANDVYAFVTDGILTLSEQSATNGGSAVIDTLAEWMDVATIALTDTATTADTLAFEFNSNTYVVSSDAGDTIENVIELTGVTGIVDLTTASGVNTLVIA